MSPLPRHSDVLYLIAQYLQAKGLYSSSLALQQESGLDVTWLRGSSRELALLRRWVFDGDVQRARALLLPLQGLGGVPDELGAAQLALDELEVLVAQTHGEKDPLHESRLAEAKLKCFERLVPLFRAPVDEEERDVFKYVAMPKLQLVGLIHDAALFRRQSGDCKGESCISVTCSVDEYDGKDGEHDDLLLLDRSQGAVLNRDEYGHYSADVGSVARSVDWSSRQRRQQNSMTLSMSLRKHQRIEDQGEEDNEVNVIKQYADAAVSCTSEIKETAEAAVSCIPEVKKTADAAVSCHPDVKKTAEIGVSCGANEWSEVATQTELDCVEDREERCSTQGGNAVEEDEENQMESMSTNVAAVDISGDQAELDNQQLTYMQEDHGCSISASRRFDSSWARKSSRSLALSAFDALKNLHPETHQEVGETGMSFEEAPVESDPQALQYDDLEVDHEFPAQKQTPQCYGDLTLDHVVCASVVAEVKEPQAVRALDAHPNGTHLAIGTNARALRVFDLSTPLQQRQQQLSWSSPLNLILPLLPVALERHKHHDSGIYCVNYNRCFLHTAGAASMIASGAADGSVKVLVTKDEDPMQRQQTDELWIQRGDVNGSMGKTRALEFGSPHHLWVASTSDRRLRCWDVRRTQRSSSSGPFQTLDGHVGEIQAIAMPQPLNSGSVNTLLLSAALDKTVRLWDARSRRCERLVTSGAHAAFSLHFHPSDEKLVVSGHQDGSVALWDLRSTAREALQVVVPHQDECRSVRWSPGGQWLLSAAFDGTLCIMQAAGSTVQPVASYHKHYGKVLQAQWHPTVPAFVSSGADKRVKLWAFV